MSRTISGFISNFNSSKNLFVTDTGDLNLENNFVKHKNVLMINCTNYKTDNKE